MCRAVGAPNTLKGYRRYVENNIKPYLGDKQICKVTAPDIQSLYRRLQKRGALMAALWQGPRCAAYTMY